MDHASGRGEPQTPSHRSHRPLSDPSARPRHGPRGDARRADRSRTGRQDPVLRLLDVSRVVPGASAFDQRAAWPQALRVRDIALFHLRAEHRARCPAGRSAFRHGTAGMESVEWRMAHREIPPRCRGSKRFAGRPRKGTVGRALPDPADAVRPVATRQSTQARHDRAAFKRCERGRYVACADGARVSVGSSRCDRRQFRGPQHASVQRCESRLRYASER